MVRKRITTVNGNRRVVYSRRKEAEKAKLRAPGSQRIQEVRKHSTRSGVEELPNPPWYAVIDVG